jgi:hypothetical protein
MKKEPRKQNEKSASQNPFKRWIKRRKDAQEKWRKFLFLSKINELESRKKACDACAADIYSACASST